MIEKIFRAWANGMSKVFAGQTFDEYEQMQELVSIINQTARQIELALAAHGYRFQNFEVMRQRINTDLTLNQIVRTDAEIQMLIQLNNKAHQTLQQLRK